MPPIIEVHDLVKRYRLAETNAVDGVSFDVAPGSFFALLGPNGAGKTTTISILTTTLAPTGGTVRVAGHDVVAEAADVRASVGIIFQNPSLDMNLTAEENVRFHAVLYGLYPFRPTYRLMPADYRRRIEELATVLGIQDDIFKPIRTFSGGMKRKLEILRSLIHKPQVLFLDEPTAGLDPVSRRNLWEYLAEVRREYGTTVFLTTHYLEEAEDVDLVCVINHGKIVSLGTPAAIKAELAPAYLLVDTAEGDRARLRAELARHGVAVATDAPAPYRIPLEGRDVHALLRAVETPLSLVRTHTPSLEDAYLHIVGYED